MAKRCNPIPSSEIDTTNEDPKYWENILRREGLSMARGLHPNVYVGSSKDLDDITQGAPVQVSGHYGTVQSSQQ